jgi:hypothetical protein
MVTEPPWPLFGRTTVLNVAVYCASAGSIPAGQQESRQVTDATVDLYGSVSVSLRRFWVDCRQDRFRWSG